MVLAVFLENTSKIPIIINKNNGIMAVTIVTAI